MVIEFHVELTTFRQVHNVYSESFVSWLSKTDQLSFWQRKRDFLNDTCISDGIGLHLIHSIYNLFQVRQ